MMGEAIREIDYIIELESGVKHCKHDDVKDCVQKSIINSTVGHYKYCNIMQMELIDASGIEPLKRIKMYGSKFRKLVKKGIYSYNKIKNLLYKNN